MKQINKDCEAKEIYEEQYDEELYNMYLSDEETVAWEEFRSSIKLCMPTNNYIAWLEAKATAYDRLMSGGKKTLKEWANIFGLPVAVDQNGEASCFEHIPVMCYNRSKGIWANSQEHYGEETYLLPTNLIDFDIDWKDSLTLPDGWEEK